MDAIDLDVVVPQPKTATLGGVDYPIPADMPMEIFLRMNLAGQLVDEDGNPDQLKSMQATVDTLADLFVWVNPDAPDAAEKRATVEKIIRQRSVKQCFTMLRTLYPAGDVAGEANESTESTPQTEDSNGTKNLSTLPPPTIPAVPTAPAAS